MVSKFIKFLLLGLSTILLVGVLYTSNSFAEENDGVSESDVVEESAEVTATPTRIRLENAKERIMEARERNKELREKMEARVTEAAAKREERLSEARMKICEARAKNIENRLSMMQKRAEVIHKGHEKIYARVDEFYTGKLVPNGFTLSNYADLKAEVAANKANVATLLEAAKTSGEGFDCSSEDPKGQVEAFQEDMKDLIEANKTYKESIHTFVKAVRDLAKTAKLSSVPSKSPSPTEEAAE